MKSELKLALGGAFVGLAGWAILNVGGAEPARHRIVNEPELRSHHQEAAPEPTQEAVAEETPAPEPEETVIASSSDEQGDQAEASDQKQPDPLLDAWLELNNSYGDRKFDDENPSLECQQDCLKAFKACPMASDLVTDINVNKLMAGVSEGECACVFDVQAKGFNTQTPILTPESIDDYCQAFDSMFDQFREPK